MRRGKKLLRVVCVIIAIVMSFSTISVQAETKKTNEEKAIAYLDKAASKCDTVMDTIYQSWYFQVYKTGEYYAEMLTSYGDYTGIKPSKVKSIVKKNYGESYTNETGLMACISVLDVNLDIVHTYYVDKGTFDKIDDNLKKAKKIINKMKDSDKKTKLKEYYNAVNKYYKFVKSPSGSFSKLGDKMDSLQSAVEECQEELSWD
jgi:hypothetical protein